MWCIPPQQNAAFVCAMEEVLDVYQRPYDPRYPKVCMDEKLKQLVKQTRRPQPARPGQIARQDYEYERNGMANIFLFCEPLRSWRKVNVTARRTKLDWAAQIKELVDVHYPQAEQITLVCDNLNTHELASLYEAFAPEEARRLIKKLRVVHTPKHGSWLNMAEIELAAMSKQCLADRVPDAASLRTRVAAWEGERNDQQVGIDWQFTTADARTKLRRLYPQIQA